MRYLNIVILGLVLCMACATEARAGDKPSGKPTLVGRITYIEGQLLRYVFAEKDWVATVKDAPFGLDDALYSNEAGKAEFKLPNGTWARVGADTQIQLIALREDATEIDVAAGISRFYNKSQNAVVKVTTPFGYALSQPGTAFDLYVGDGSAEIICLDGTVDFILEGGQGKYTVTAGGPSIISDGKQAVKGDGNVDADWDEWNLKREELWTQRVQVRGESVEFLPPELQDDSYEFEENGRWERVNYEGESRPLWRPNVAPDWRPFTVGRWTVYHEDNCWIPEEPYGYVTHHYGNWIFVNGGWYWAPPVRARIGYIGGCACWYPGRVAWIHSGVDIGWVPLAPAEVYYSHRYWGPASVFVGAVDLAALSINLAGLAFVSHAVIVPQRAFYSVNSYYGVRIASFNRAVIVRDFRAAPVVSNAVIANYSTMRSRYIYSTNLARIAFKPHYGVVGRIDRNRAFASRQAGRLSAAAIRGEAARIGRGRLMTGPQAARLQAPRLTGRMVPAGQVHAPGSELRFRQREIKTRGRPSAAGSLQREGLRGRPGAGGAGVPGTRVRSGGSAGGAGGQPALRGTRRIPPPTAERRRQIREQQLRQGRQTGTREMSRQGRSTGAVEQQRRQRLQNREQPQRSQERLRQQNLRRPSQSGAVRQGRDRQAVQGSGDRSLRNRQQGVRSGQQMVPYQGRTNRQGQAGRVGRIEGERPRQGQGGRRQESPRQREAPRGGDQREMRQQHGPHGD